MAMGDAFLRQGPHIAGRNRMAAGQRGDRARQRLADGVIPRRRVMVEGRLHAPGFTRLDRRMERSDQSGGAGAALSVVIPTLNAAAGLPTTLACLNQRAAGDLALEVHQRRRLTR